MPSGLTPVIIAPIVAAALLVGLCTPALCGEPVAKLTFADAELGIIRRTTLYRAAAGMTVHSGDILETHEGTAQIEVLPALIVGIAPHSRILLRIGRGNPAGCDVFIYNLEGIVKIARSRTPNGLACLQSAQRLASLASGSALQEYDGSAVSFFVEDGSLTVQGAAVSASLDKPVTVLADQFAQCSTAKPIELLGRPTPQFLASIPANFRDSLVPMTDRVGDDDGAAIALREVSYADIAEWLKAPSPQRREFVRQFLPRLKDPEFRRAIDAELGASAEWGPILHPPPPQTSL